MVVVWPTPALIRQDYRWREDTEVHGPLPFVARVYKVNDTEVRSVRAHFGNKSHA